MAIAVIASCGQQNATVPSESTASIPLEVQPRDPQAATPAPTSTPDVVESPVDDPTAEPVAPTSEAAVDPVDEAPEELTPTATANQPTSQDEISPRGQALGCVDATGIRRWMASARPSIAEAAQPMADQVWLCPNNDDVTEQLTCYPNETNAVLAALRELGDETSDIVDQIAGSGTTFCASGDVIRLGINDLLERIEDDDN